MTNSIKNLLEIQDENIEIIGEIKEVKIKGQRAKIVEGKLRYQVEYCKCCGCKNKDYTIVKDGFRKTKVKLLKVSEIPVILNLYKQRYYCKNCNKKFTAQTKLVSEKSSISNLLKSTILFKLKNTLSNKYIAKDMNVSETTVIRIIQKASKYLKLNVYKDLPEHLCFDEIKSTKDAEGHMSFVFSDAQTGSLIDIIDNRKYTKLKLYFSRIPRKIRKKVKTICIDIYPPYIKLIREMFPNAEIIIDRFHIIQNINREFNKYRIQLMNKYKNRNKESHKYTKLKNYWRLLLKDYSEVSYAKTHYSRTFSGTVSNKQVLDYILSIDETLANNYKVMQDIRYAVKQRNMELFKSVIESDTNLYSKGIKKAINTIRKHNNYMLNSIKYKYSNGVLEGINNKIKLIKRISYGYSSFYNFRLRVLIVFRLFEDDFMENKNIMQHKSAA